MRLLGDVRLPFTRFLAKLSVFRGSGSFEHLPLDQLQQPRGLGFEGKEVTKPLGLYRKPATNKRS